MAREARHSTKICEKLQTVLDLLGKRWTGIVIQALRDGPLRFGELKKTVEVVTDKMLSERLKELEEAGVIERRVLQRPVLGVEYALTEKGRALGRVFSAMERWADEWVELPARKSARGG